jgi:hypothetical protein
MGAGTLPWNFRWCLRGAALQVQWRKTTLSPKVFNNLDCTLRIFLRSESKKYGIVKGTLLAPYSASGLRYNCCFRQADVPR